MNKQAKLAKLKARAVAIKARGKYLEAPGVYKKVLKSNVTVSYELLIIWIWRNLVSRCIWDAETKGSNPFIQTMGA